MPVSGSTTARPSLSTLTSTRFPQLDGSDLSSNHAAAFQSFSAASSMRSTCRVRNAALAARTALSSSGSSGATATASTGSTPICWAASFTVVPVATA